MSQSRLLSTGAVAALHGVSSRTIRYAVQRGELDAREIIGADGCVESYAIPEAAAKRWVRRRAR